MGCAPSLGRMYAGANMGHPSTAVRKRNSRGSFVDLVWSSLIVGRPFGPGPKKLIWTGLENCGSFPLQSLTIGGPVTRSPHDRLLYAVLAAIFLGSVAFQTVISAEVFHHIWADSRHFNPAMLRSWDLAFIAHVLTPFLCLLLGFLCGGSTHSRWTGAVLLATCLSFSVMVDGANKQEEAMQWATPFNHLALVYRSLGLYTFPFWLALFAIYFPEQAEWELRKPALKWIVLIPLGGFERLHGGVSRSGERERKPRSLLRCGTLLAGTGFGLFTYP